MRFVLELKDSSCFQGIGQKKEEKEKEEQEAIRSYHGQCAAYMRAVDELQKQINEGKLKTLCLQSYNPQKIFECPVQYEIKSYGTTHNKYVVTNCSFSSSHYIGRFTYGDCSIIVNPRFGNIFSYLVGYATNLYLPQGDSVFSNNTKNNSYWLIALIWTSLLNKALTEGQIPKEYITIHKNQKHYRGHLCVNKHIHFNICDATKFYCTYKKLSIDNTINRTIRTVYRILKEKGVSAIINEFEAYDKYLESMGVISFIADINQIENIRYTRIIEPYKPVMELSKMILSNYKSEASNKDSTKADISYFIDVAELWEMYLLKLLQKKLPDYTVYSPNSNFGGFLLKDGKDRMIREIRPDIIIEKKGHVKMIIDAKYKNYKQFGNSSDSGIHREDLYQMTTYLHHYGKKDESIIGVFTSPVKCNEHNIYTYNENRKHKIGLINLDITSNDINKIKELEDKYIEKIINELKIVCSSPSPTPPTS